MKTNKFFENSKKAMASFFLAGLVIIAYWCFKNEEYYQDMFFTHGTDIHTAMMSQTNSTSYNEDMMRLKELNGKIAKLEQKKESLDIQLEKAKLERNMDCGMAVGMYSCQPQDLSEITYLEGKIANLEYKITALKKSEKHIAEKYNLDIQNLAFMQ